MTIFGKKLVVGAALLLAHFGATARSATNADENFFNAATGQTTSLSTANNTAFDNVTGTKTEKHRTALGYWLHDAFKMGHAYREDVPNENGKFKKHKRLEGYGCRARNYQDGINRHSEELRVPDVMFFLKNEYK